MAVPVVHPPDPLLQGAQLDPGALGQGPHPELFADGDRNRSAEVP